MPAFADAFDTGRNPFLPPRRQQRNPFLAEDDSESPAEPDAGLLSTISRASLSGLEKVGNFFDIPGSMARDFMAGKNPLDQLISPLSGANRTTGRELARHYGLAGDEDTYANWWGGLGVELLTDPLTYTGFGALTKAGKAVRAAGLSSKAPGLAGKLAGTFGDVLAKSTPAERTALEAAAKGLGSDAATLAAEAQPLASLFEFGIPFTGSSLHVGTGPLAQKVAGALDAIPQMLTRPSKLTGLGLPEGLAQAATYPGRMALSLFDPTVMGQVTEAGQQIGREMYAGQQAAERAARGALADVIHDMDEIRAGFAGAYGADIQAGVLGQLPGQAKVAGDAVQDAFERVFGLATELGGDLDTALSEFNLAASRLTPELRQKFVDLGDKMQKANRELHLMNRLKGGKGGILEDLTAQGAMPGFEHFPRYVKPDRLDDFQRALKNFATRHGSTYARDEVISHVPQEVINRLLMDEKARDATTGAAHIASQYGQYLGKQMVKDPQGNLVPRWASVAEHATELNKWVQGRKEWALFTRSQIENFFKYQRGAHLADQAYDSIHRLIQGNLSPAGALVEDVFKAADMDVDRAADWLGSLMGKTADEVKQLTIPVDVAQAIVGSRKALSQPEWAGEIGRTIDTVTGWFKQAVTLPFPSFWTRNLTSGQYVNLASGLFEGGADLAQYGRHVSDAWQQFRGGLDPAYEKELLTYKVLDPDTLFEDVPAYGVADFGRVAPRSPTELGHSWQAAGEQVAESGQLLNQIPGVQRVRQAYGAVVNTGAKASRLVEYLNRVPMYEYLKAKGWSREAAAAKVAELQIDYGALAPFEKQVMRRLVPFYSFQRKIAPVLLKALVQRPGGVIGQTLRIARDAREADATTPDYVAETLSIPNPFETGEGGVKSYWTGLGLPFEQHLQYLGGGVRGGLLEAASQLNPLVKAPLEWATNQSFFQRGPAGAGRQLDDLDPTLGRTLANLLGRDKPVPTPQAAEFLLANSPATRFLSTARQLTDPRKTWFDTALNSLTGTRVTDVSPAAQDAILRERAIALMRGMDAAEFSRVYFRQEDLTQMSPEERAVADRLTQLQTILATRAKERKLKKAGEAAAPALQ
jgi:hypothetical protein